MVDLGVVVLVLCVLTLLFSLGGYRASRPRLDPYDAQVLKYMTCETCGYVSRCAKDGLAATIYGMRPTETRLKWVAWLYITNTADAQLAIWTRKGFLRDQEYDKFCAAFRKACLIEHHHATVCRHFLLAWQYYSNW